MAIKVNYEEMKSVVENIKVLTQKKNSLTFRFGTKEAGENVECTYMIVNGAEEQLTGRFLAKKPSDFDGNPVTLVVNAAAFVANITALLSLEDAVSFNIGAVLKISVGKKAEIAMPILSADEADATLPDYKGGTLAQFSINKMGEFKDAVKKGSFAATSEVPNLDFVMFRLLVEQNELEVFTAETAMVAGAKCFAPVATPAVVKKQLDEKVAMFTEKGAPADKINTLKATGERRVQELEMVEEARKAYCEETKGDPMKFAFAISTGLFKNFTKLCTGAEAINVIVSKTQMYVCAGNIVYVATLTKCLPALFAMYTDKKAVETKTLLQVDVDEFLRHLTIMMETNSDQKKIAVSIEKKGEALLLQAKGTKTVYKLLGSSGDDVRFFLDCEKLKKMFSSLKKGNALIGYKGEKDVIEVFNSSIETQDRDTAYAFLLPVNPGKPEKKQKETEETEE